MIAHADPHLAYPHCHKIFSFIFLFISAKCEYHRQDNYSSCWHITRNSRYSTCGKNPDPRFVWLWMLNYFMLIFIFTNYFRFSFFFNLAKCECCWNNYKTSCWHTTRQRHTDMQPVALKLLLLLLRLILWVVLIALMKCIT